MRAYERLLKYVTVRTPSDETSTTVPSSACQFDLAQDLIRVLAARKKIYEEGTVIWRKTEFVPSQVEKVLA